MLYRNWSWGQGSASEPQTGSDLGAGAVAGFRHVLPSKLVFDVHMSAGFVSSETLEGRYEQPAWCPLDQRRDQPGLVALLAGRAARRN